MGSRLSTARHSVTNSDALFDTAAELYGINREMVGCGVTFQLKREISANNKLLECLQVQFKSTKDTLRSMSGLKCKLHQSRSAVLLILRDGAHRAEMLKMLKELESMRPVLVNFKSVCYNHHDQLMPVLDDLRWRQHDLEHNKLPKIKAWKKGWNICVWIVKSGVTVLSVVFPLAGARAVATAANNGASGVIALLQPVVDSRFADRQSSFENERELNSKILKEALFMFHKVKNTRLLVEMLEDQLLLLPQSAEFLTDAGEDVDEDGAVSIVRLMTMEKKVKGNAGEFVDKIESLEKEMDSTCLDIRRAALSLLHAVTDQVGNYQHLQTVISVPI